MKKHVIKFARLRDGAVIPSKRPGDAGYDIYPVLLDGDVVIQPHQTVKIHTGIASVFDESRVAIIKERSSTGSKGLEVRSGVFDSTYRGEWIIVITNGTEKRMVITENPKKFMDDMWTAFPANKAIAQAVILKLPKDRVEEITAEELEEYKTDRGNGGFGSSGK